MTNNYLASLIKNKKKDYFVMHSTKQIIASSYYPGFGLFYMKSLLNLFVIWHKQKIQ